MRFRKTEELNMFFKKTTYAAIIAIHFTGILFLVFIVVQVFQIIVRNHNWLEIHMVYYKTTMLVLALIGFGFIYTAVVLEKAWQNLYGEKPKMGVTYFEN